MKRFLVPPVLVAAVAILAGVSNPAPPSSATERARELHRNRVLIKKVVNGGLLLAKEEDPFDRARRCNDIADGLAHDLELAADDGDGMRVGQLAFHYHRLMEKGVATNLTAARRKTPVGSTGERKLDDFRRESAGAAQRLEKRLAGSDNRYLRGALHDVKQGRIEVENSLDAPPNE
jgi:hypothetical protein